MSKTLRAGGCALTLAALALASPSTAVAYEVDVHYGLTYWLARQAGLKDDCAREIADATQYVDVSHYTNPVNSTLFAAVFQDIGASRAVRETHFPTDDEVPREPHFRNVEADGLRVRRLVRAELEHDAAWRVSARRLGRALHTYQDSWSHAGIPDIPVLGDLVQRAAARLQSSPVPKQAKKVNRIVLEVLGGFSDGTPRSQLLWGHPISRSGCGKSIEQGDGWHRHDADLTYCHANKPELEKLSKRTFEWLKAFRKRHSDSCDGGASAANWSVIEEKVSEFARCRTKLQKKHWFEANCDEDYLCGYPPTGLNTTGGKRACIKHAPFAWLNLTSLECGKPRETCGGEISERASRAAATSSAMVAAQRETPRFEVVFASSRQLKTPQDSEADESCEDCVDKLSERYPSLAAEKFLREFLDDWLETAKNREKRNQLVEDYVDNSAVASIYDRFATEELDWPKWSRFFLDMWLCQDHGLVNARGHGSPAVDLTDWRQECGEDTADFGDVRFVYEARPVGKNEKDEWVYLGLVRVSSAPADVVALAFVLEPKRKILLMDWLVH